MRYNWDPNAPIHFSYTFKDTLIELIDERVKTLLSQEGYIIGKIPENINIENLISGDCNEE